MKPKKERARTISPRIKESTREALAEAYGNANAGAQQALRSWIPLRDAVRKFLLEFFTSAELDIITSAYEDARFYPETALSQSSLSVRIEVELRSHTDNPEAAEKLTEKIERLEPAERLYLVELAIGRQS